MVWSSSAKIESTKMSLNLRQDGYFEIIRPKLSNPASNINDEAIIPHAIAQIQSNFLPELSLFVGCHDVAKGSQPSSDCRSRLPSRSPASASRARLAIGE